MVSIGTLSSSAAFKEALVQVKREKKTLIGSSMQKCM